MRSEVSSSLSPRMAKGATPAGVAPGDEREASRRIREMFSRVAPRYDLLNRLLSLRIDQLWRRRLVREVRPYLARPDTRILDLCCGTGDLMLALAAEKERLAPAPFPPVLGADFCRPMLRAAQSKLAAQAKRNARDTSRPLIEADALHLPLASHSIDLITIAWGFRNLANYNAGLRECHRLLAPGGCLAILEFSQPSAPLLGPLFTFYFRNILPRVGNVVSGSRGAYSYLQSSVDLFLSPAQLTAQAREAGFSEVKALPLTGGISVLHLCYQ